MFFKNVRYCLWITGWLFCTIHSFAQSNGEPLNVSFGHGSVYDPSKAGPPLSTGYTEYSYTTNICPSPGHYTIVNGITGNCFNNEWISVPRDNTPYPDSNGYMMLINDTSYLNPRIVFMDSVKETCHDVDYEFSAAVINLEKPSNECVKFSSLTLQVEDNYGNIIASTSTGDIEFAMYIGDYYFTKYFVDFRVPAGVSGIVLKIFDIPKSQAITCQNALAIDDIKLEVAGSVVKIGFDTTFNGDPVKNLCFHNNSPLTMFGTIDSAISNPVVQWQQSNDNGTTWMDIPGATHYTYTQNFSRPDTFLFHLRASDLSHISSPACSVFSNILQVRVNGDPTNVIISNNSPLCAGNDLNLTAAGGDLYTWTGPNGFFDTASSPHISSPLLKDSGTYSVKIATLGGCSIQDSTRVIMIGTDVHASPDTSICKGNSIQLSVTPGLSYSWSPSESLSNSSINNPVAKPGVTTEYAVIVTDGNGCHNMSKVEIKILNNTEVKAIITGPEFLCRPHDFGSFKNVSTGDIIKWNWNFGNGQTDNTKNPPVQNYSIQDTQTVFIVRLAVMDSAGCNDSTFYLIKVENSCNLMVPSAFTPNGDGLNDYLYPLNAYHATNLSFRIFNRVGQMVFESGNATRKWDGKVNSKPLPTGVYVWILEYNDQNGKKVSLKGTTVLIR